MSEKVIPAVDEDTGEDGLVQFDLEFRVEGEESWHMSYGGSLSIRKGLPTKASVKREVGLVQYEKTPEWFDSSVPEPKPPKLEFRVVRKDFVVNRTVVQKFQL